MLLLVIICVAICVASFLVIVVVVRDVVKSVILKDRARMAEVMYGAGDSVRNAGPELLEACKLFRRWMLGGQPGPFSDSAVLTIVNQAIEKAQPRASVDR